MDNGLLLRSDVHTLFDRGYLGVPPGSADVDGQPASTRRLGNGEEFYARERAKQPLRPTLRNVDAPRTDFLEWHADVVFKAS